MQELIEIPLILSADDKKLILKKVQGQDFEMGVPPEQMKYWGHSDNFFMRMNEVYWLGVYPITQAQWQAFGFPDIEKRYILDKKRYPTMENVEKIWVYVASPNFPQSDISWVEAMQFCKKLTIEYQHLLPAGYHFSLPTEAQWEFACRAGEAPYISEELKIKLYEEKLCPHLTYYGEHLENRREVGVNNRNPWGFYDMLGNVSEFIFDIATWSKEDYYAHNPVPFEYTVEDKGEFRIVRGTVAMTACRERLGFRTYLTTCGFRIALRPVDAYDISDPFVKELGLMPDFIRRAYE